MNEKTTETLQTLSSTPKGIKKQRKKRGSYKKRDSEAPKLVELSPQETPTEEISTPAQENTQKTYIFKPNPGPQTQFLASSEQEVLYGGAAGGGKSYAMVADPVRYFDNNKFRGLLLRRTNDELRELINVSKQLYPALYPGGRGQGAHWTEREKTWTFPSGATLWMSYLEKDDDVYRYQGQAFSWIGFDELTQWSTPFAWNYMRSRLRTTTESGLPLCMRATSNPGGVGHHWVKKAFVDPAPAGKAFWARNLETNEVLTWPKNSEFAVRNGLVGKPMFKRRFIPANLFDNPYLAEDGAYEANLLSLPEHQRKQLLEGNWDVNEGAAFPEWNRSIHVVPYFEIPNAWAKFRACDYGYGSQSAVIWFAVDPNTDQLIIYDELFKKGVTAVDLADMILERELGYRIRYGVLDSSMWHQRGDTGPSMAEKMIARGCRWRPSDRSKGSRVSGKNELHRLLQVDNFTQEPRLVVMENCLELISQLPSIPLDKKNPDDVDTNFVNDHGYDAVRYGIMSRPRSNLWDSSERHRQSYRPADSIFGY